MSDLWTRGTSASGQDTSAPDPPPDEARPGRRIARARSLPGSRAVVGALLVTAAAVGVFSAYLDATAEPDTAYVVAVAEIPIGTVLDERTLTDPSLFGAAAIELPDQVARTAVRSDRALQLDGRVTTVPYAAGEMLTRSGTTEAELTDGAGRFSFSIDASRAVGGALEGGDRIDLVATFGGGADVVTRYVARDVLLTGVAATDAGITGGTGSLVLTLALPAGDVVLDVAQALDVGEVFVVRAPIATGADAPDTEGSADGVRPPADVPAPPPEAEDPPTEDPRTEDAPDETPPPPEDEDVGGADADDED